MALQEPTPITERAPVFSLDRGLLYQWVEGKSQLVASGPLPAWVMSLAHDPPLACHVGGNKTLDRILQQFYWPGLQAQIQKYCAECREYQFNQNKVVQSGPLQPMSLISVSFEWVGIDIVGLLIQSSSGHKFLLIFID